MKELRDINFEEFSTESINNQRHYNVNGNKYKSITTFLGEFTKDSINEWRKRVGEEEANRISNRAATNGTKMHSIVESYLLGEPDYQEKIKTSFEKMQFNKIKKFLDDHIIALHQEVVLFSNKLQLAGRVDCIGLYDNVPAIIDFKTSSKPKKKEWIENYFLQTTFYSMALYEMTGIPVKDVLILIMIPDSSLQVFHENVSNYFEKLIKMRKSNA